MVKNIAAISFIYFCVCLAWCLLGNTVLSRSYDSKANLQESVDHLWGTAQVQNPPSVAIVTTQQDGKKVAKPIALSASNIDVKLDLAHRKKGLLTFPTYHVHFDGKYTVDNTSDQEKSIAWSFHLPSEDAVYDNLRMQIDGTPLPELAPDHGNLSTQFQLQPHQKTTVEVAYDSQGVNEWKYGARSGATQVRNFQLTAHTNFAAIDFPERTRSATLKSKAGNGWNLTWKYDNTVSGNLIGITMPRLLNPGPWVSDVTFFAPVSLFFFFFVVWLITTVKSIPIHPMHYFFIGAAFFSFHLLLAYSVDHIPLQVAFAIASIVSLSLVLTYIRRAVPDAKFFTQIGLAQFVYLIFFSFTFFLEQFTGLIITRLSIATLFVSMQCTARFDWGNLRTNRAIGSDDALAIIEGEYGTPA